MLTLSNFGLNSKATKPQITEALLSNAEKQAHEIATLKEERRSLAILCGVLALWALLF